MCLCVCGRFSFHSLDLSLTSIICRDIIFLVIYTLHVSAFGDFLADVNNWEREEQENM